MAAGWRITPRAFLGADEERTRHSNIDRAARGPAPLIGRIHELFVH
jgi:hypothetical protein